MTGRDRVGPVGGLRPRPLHVVKIGSGSQAHPGIYDELAVLAARGVRLLVVAGGATGIASHYQTTNRPIRTLTLRSGDPVRYCPPEEMAHLVAAYEQVTLPGIRDALQQRGLNVLAVPAFRGLAAAQVAPPFSALVDGRRRVVRDHRAGTVAQVDADRIAGLLNTVDALVVSPPGADVDGGPPVNVDADVLAAELAAALDADHLRLVTGTAGLLRDPADPASGLPEITLGEGMAYARGRMRQKVRAAEIALAGGADVAICGPHLVSPVSGTRVWRTSAPAPDLTLLTRAVEIASVSGDERELADYLLDWCTGQGLAADVDPAGNLVASRGEGPRRLMLLGHLDTVPHRWPVRWDGDTLHGRGCVDAKASLIVFLTVLAGLSVPPGQQVTVVGAVGEEATSEGAAWLAAHTPAPAAIVIGEPSGAAALTIGYHGLVKLRVRLQHPVGHTAGQGVSTAADRLADLLHEARASVGALHPDALLATLGSCAGNDGDLQRGEAVVDIRVPTGLEPAAVVAAVAAAAGDADVEVLRATPGSLTPRSHPLVRGYARAVQAATGSRPRYLAKKGSSDINTLIGAWGPVPWLAYGPGDAALDHAPDEHLPAAEYRTAVAVTHRAVSHWLTNIPPLPTNKSLLLGQKLS